jgi:hypothetical protein
MNTPSPPSFHKEEIIIDYENVSYKHQTQAFVTHLPHYTKDYIVSLFPIASWIHRYNLMVCKYIISVYFYLIQTYN